MSTSERTLNQVRAILNKLDRSIDEARERRTQPPLAIAHPAPVPQPAPQPTLPQQITPPPSTSAYGRAQPMPRPQATNLLRFNK